MNDASAFLPRTLSPALFGNGFSMNSPNKSGVFEYLLDQLAFIDRVTLSAWSAEPPVLKSLTEVTNVPSLSRKSMYGRMVTGNWKRTGNPARILYGRRDKFPNVPPVRIVLDSTVCPLSGAQVSLLCDDILPGCERVVVSTAELAADLTSTSVGELRRQAVYRARHTKFLGTPETGSTFYIGARASSSQGKVYSKLNGVTRVEFTLRGAYLKRKKMRKPAELVKLKSLDLSEQVSFMEVSELRLERATKSWSAEGKAMARDFAFRRLRSRFLRFLRTNKIPPESVLMRSETHNRVQSMIEQLYW